MEIYTIYKIVNKVNDNVVYIGQTKRDLKKRWKAHERTTGKGNCPKLAEAIDISIKEYGKNIYYPKIIDFAYDQEKANELEINYIKLYNTFLGDGYNMTKGGGNYPDMTEDIRKKISNSKKGKKRPDLSKRNSENKGKPNPKLKKKLLQKSIDKIKKKEAGKIFNSNEKFHAAIKFEQKNYFGSCKFTIEEAKEDLKRLNEIVMLKNPKYFKLSEEEKNRIMKYNTKKDFSSYKIQNNKGGTVENIRNKFRATLKFKGKQYSWHFKNTYEEAKNDLLLLYKIIMFKNPKFFTLSDDEIKNIKKFLDNDINGKLQRSISAINNKTTGSIYKKNDKFYARVNFNYKRYQSKLRKTYEESKNDLETLYKKVISDNANYFKILQSK